MPKMTAPRRSRNLLLFGLAMLAALAAQGAASELAGALPADGDERLEYRWHVQGFIGAVAGLFFPAEGEGSLSRRRLPSGNLETELLITSSADKKPDYFRYGAETAAVSGATLRAWSSQLWRGKRKEKAGPVEQPGAVDVASAIQLLRRERPTSSLRMEIWSDGKLYPVRVQPLGRESVRIAGRNVPAQHIAVRPVTEPGRRAWKGELDLWLAEDTASTPVKILVSRSPARVLLELARYP